MPNKVRGVRLFKNNDEGCNTSDFKYIQEEEIKNRNTGFRLHNNMNMLKKTKLPLHHDMVYYNISDSKYA